MRKGRGRLISLVDTGGDEPIHERVATHIRKLIVEGAIDAGARLPAQRMLARDWGVSRNTVTAALHQLASEGLLEAQVGSGTYVTVGAARLARVRRRARLPLARRLLPLEVGIPDVELFPMERWARVQAHCWRHMSRPALQEGHHAGWPPLREIIADRVSATRGVSCSPDQVFITPSAQASAGLAATVLAVKGETAWIEDPGYFRTREALSAAGLTVKPIPVDEEGFDLGAARRGDDARIACVTPGAQFPTGVTMSATRRSSLLDWAKEAGGWIIEDDFEAEFHFGVRPAPPLAAASGGNRVVYVGTFNNILFPALRIAFLIAPESEADRFLASDHIALRAANVPNQVVLHAFMDQGHLASHLRTCRDLFEERRSILLESLRSEFDTEWRISAPRMGLLVQAWMPSGSDDVALKRAVGDQGIVVSAMRAHAIGGCQPGLFLGFSGHRPEQIRKAVRVIAQQTHTQLAQ